MAPRINVRPSVTTPGLTALVLDATSNAPVYSAQVVVPALGWAAVTDSMGFARLPKLTPGNHTLRVRAVGYKAAVDTITIPRSGGRFLIVQLTCFPNSFGAGGVTARVEAVAVPQARPLQPADFNVANIPDNFPDVDIETDTSRIRRILGPPHAIRRFEFQPVDTLTTWEYDGLSVTFGSIGRSDITLTSPRIATHRGLRVGDTEMRARMLYGTPSESSDDQWTYEDPREHLHAIIVTVREGRVVQIFVGSIWD